MTQSLKKPDTKTKAQQMEEVFESKYKEVLINFIKENELPLLLQNEEYLEIFESAKSGNVSITLYPHNTDIAEVINEYTAPHSDFSLDPNNFSKNSRILMRFELGEYEFFYKLWLNDFNTDNPSVEASIIFDSTTEIHYGEWGLETLTIPLLLGYFEEKAFDDKSSSLYAGTNSEFLREAFEIVKEYNIEEENEDALRREIIAAQLSEHHIESVCYNNVQHANSVTLKFVTGLSLVTSYDSFLEAFGYSRA